MTSYGRELLIVNASIGILFVAIFGILIVSLVLPGLPHTVTGRVDAVDCSSGFSNVPVIVLSGIAYDAEKEPCVLASLHIGEQARARVSFGKIFTISFGG